MAWTRILTVLVVVFGMLHGEALVQPPTNVTLHCRNLKNILHWNYEEQSPHIQFRVDVYSYFRSHNAKLIVVPPTLHADLSPHTDPDDDYVVTVTAVDGANESEAAPADGLTFSYFENSPSSQKCFVDLPSVNVTAQPDDSVEFRFPHPWLLYHKSLSTNKKSRKKKSHGINISKLPEFNYAVVVVSPKETHHSFSCMESVCEQKLPVDGGQEPHCLRINGRLEKMVVRATKDYCTLQQPVFQKPDYLYIIYIMVSLLVVGVIVLILFMVYRKQTQAWSLLPSVMRNTGQPRNEIMIEPHLTPEQFSVPEVLPSSPTETPLLQVEESTPGNTPGPERDIRLAIGVAGQDEREPDDVEVRGEEAEGSGYGQGRELDDDVSETENNAEDFNSGYERREQVVELAPGDQARGYHG